MPFVHVYNSASAYSLPISALVEYVAICDTPKEFTNCPFSPPWILKKTLFVFGLKKLDSYFSTTTPSQPVPQQSWVLKTLHRQAGSFPGEMRVTGAQPYLWQLLKSGT